MGRFWAEPAEQSRALLGWDVGFDRVDFAWRMGMVVDATVVMVS